MTHSIGILPLKEDNKKVFPVFADLVIGEAFRYNDHKTIYMKYGKTECIQLTGASAGTSRHVSYNKEVIPVTIHGKWEDAV